METLVVTLLMNLSKSTLVHDAVPKQSSKYLAKESGMGPVYCFVQHNQQTS